MKRRMLHFAWKVCLIALLVLTIVGMIRLDAMHREACPQLYLPGVSQSWLPIAGAVIGCLLTPVVHAIAGKLSGYRVEEIAILFIRISFRDKISVRLGRAAFGVVMLPPRLDGTSPFRRVLLCVPLYTGALTLLSLLLMIPCWNSAAFRSLLLPFFFFFSMTLVRLWPRRNGFDALTVVSAYSRSADLVRAWECAVHINKALSEKKALQDMPDAWFQTYPAELAENPYVANCMISGSSRLIRQERYAEAYETLRPLLDLEPAPDTHQTIACAVLNGAICEVMAELPPMCLSQLEHQSVKYMCPPAWQGRALTAKYARAIFLRHDEAEAAAILAEISRLPDGQRDGPIIRQMQEKAGVGVSKEEACSPAKAAGGGQG